MAQASFDERSLESVLGAPAGQPAWQPSRVGSLARRLAAVAVLMGVAAAAVGGYLWYRGGGDSAPAKHLATHTVVRDDLVVTVTEDGTLESSANLDVKCEVAGGTTILWIIKDGSEVEEGEPIARLDSAAISEQVSVQDMAYETALATRIESAATFAAAKIAVDEFELGTYVQQSQTLEGQVTVALEGLRSAENLYQHTERMARKGYVTGLQRDSQAFAVEKAKLDLANARTAKKVLDAYTFHKTLETLKSQRETAEAKLRAAEAKLTVEQNRLNRLTTQLAKCEIRAPHKGLVVYANETGGWRGNNASPTIEEGATVRERQSLVRLPDLSQMQVKVLVHESKADDIEPGMRARVRVQDRAFTGTVVSVANQADNGGWFSSQVKKYSTIVKIDGEPEGLLPGMTASVEVLVADKTDVLTVPVQSVVELDGAFYCWVQSTAGIVRRAVELGAKSLSSIEVARGLEAGEEVVINPQAVVADAKRQSHVPQKTDVHQKFGVPQERTAGGGKAGEKRGEPDAAKRAGLEKDGGPARSGKEVAPVVDDPARSPRPGQQRGGQSDRQAQAPARERR